MPTIPEQTLILLRHAKAVPWSPGCDDFARVLADKGQRHMARLAAWVADHLPPPDCVLCSTSARTVETLAPLLDTWGAAAPAVSYMDAMYHASAGDLHHLATEAFASHGSVLMVGHNPGFGNLARGLQPDIHRMPTGTLGTFEFATGFAGGEHDARLRRWITRKDLKR